MLGRRAFLAQAGFGLVLASSCGVLAAEGQGASPEALAALRPGAPLAALQAAFGRDWRPPGLHRQGLVDILENRLGFTARLDVRNVVGEVRYRAPFDALTPIDHLFIAMPIAEARLARPDLVIGEALKGGPPTRFGSVRAADGTLLVVEFSFGKIASITFRNPAAVYPAKLPVPYPEAAGSRGAPFKDLNLKLAVLSELLDAKAIDLGTAQDLADHASGHPVDLAAEGSHRLAAVYDYLARYPLTADLLGQVTSLTLDGGSSIYPYCFPAWDGETPDFDITSLEGIEHCPALATFQVIALVGSLDLRPLLALRHLARLDIAHTDVSTGAFAGSNAAVVTALRQRGVQVD